MIGFKFSKDHELIAFLNEMRPLFGSRKVTLLALLQSMPVYQEWRSKVSLCPHCRQWVPIRYRLKHCVILADHSMANPQEPPPAFVVCPQGNRDVHDPDIVPMTTIERWRVHIEHRIKTLGPNLL